MILDSECCDEGFSSRKFADPSVADKGDNDDDVRTYYRRHTSGSKRKTFDGLSSLGLRNVNSTVTEGEETIADSRRDEDFRMVTALEKRRNPLGMWKASPTSTSLVTKVGSKKTVAPKVRKVMGQYFLDLGQKDFSYSTCPICGLFYARGLEGDEIVHRVFHKNRTKGISFKGWQDERIVKKIDDKGSRVILVLPEDTHHRQKVKEVIAVVEAELDLSPGWLIQKACKVYLFISSSRKIVGCLMAEPIKNAYQLLPSKKQEVMKECRQDPIGQEKRSSANYREHCGSCEAPTSTKDPDQFDASVAEPDFRSEQRIDGINGDVADKVADVSDVSNVCIQVDNQDTAGSSSRILEESHISDHPLALGAAQTEEEEPSPAVETLSGVNTKSRSRKITEYFEQQSNFASVGEENDPTSSNSSPLMTVKEKSSVARACTGPRPSKISDYFIGPYSRRSSQSPEESAKKARSVLTPGSVDSQKEKEPVIFMGHKIKAESMTDVSGQIKAEEEKVNTALSRLQKEDVEHDKANLQKLTVSEDLKVPNLESRSFTSKHGTPCTIVEVKEKVNFDPSDIKDGRNCSRTAKFTAGKCGGQVNLKGEIMAKAELGSASYTGRESGIQVNLKDEVDALPEKHSGEKDKDSQVDTIVQKKPLEQKTVGANFLLFGNVKLHREVIPRKRSRQEHAEELGSAIMYNATTIPAVCGVRVIWVSSSERRKGVASHLLDTMRSTFSLGVVLETSQFAFSQPTSDGRIFAARYCKTDEFLVYTTS